MLAKDITETGTSLSWTADKDAKSWIVHHDLGSGVPGEATIMHYTEKPELVFNDALFGAPLTGKTINFYIQAFNQVFEGENEIEKAQNANTTGYGSEWSNVTNVLFSAGTVDDLKAQLDGKGIKYPKSARKADLISLLEKGE